MDDFKEELSRKENEKIRWGTIIPLIGGSALGCKEATGTLPDFHLSYSPFSGNERHIRNYWPSVPMYYLDKNSENLPNFGNVDFINSVCPCAGLSMLNTSSSGGKKRGADAAANRWMYESSVYILSKVRPKVLWGENAPGLFTTLGEGVIEKLRKIGEHFGYSFSVMKTSTDFHGIPQRRVRTFYFFWKSPTVPKMTYYSRERKNLLDYLNEIPIDAPMTDIYLADGKASERARYYQFILEKEGLTHAEFVKKIGKGTVTTYLEEHNLIDECIEWLKEKYPKESFWNKTGNNRTHIEYLEHVKKKRAAGLGYWDDSPRFVGDTFAAVMKKTMMWGVHPEEDRFLNAREFMHLMGLPHDFQLHDAERSINHIAQNVPTCTARDMAEQVTKFIRGELEMTNFCFMRQDNTNQTIVTAVEGYVAPIGVEDLNNLERNIKLLEFISAGDAAEPVKKEKKIVFRKEKKPKQELSEEERQMLEIDREIKREKEREIRKQLREAKDQRIREERAKNKELRDEERAKNKEMRDKERQLRIEMRRAKQERRLSERKVRRSIVVEKESKVPLDPEEVAEEEKKFMCKICLIFPRDDSRNKSELYRHYSLVHYPKEIKEAFLTMKSPEPCPFCPDDGKGPQKMISSKDISHIGQTHSKVEMFMPKEYHVQGSKRRSSIMPRIHSTIVPKNNNVKENLFYAVELNDEEKVKPEAKPVIEVVDDEDDEVDEEIRITEVKTRSGRLSRSRLSQIDNFADVKPFKSEPKKSISRNYVEETDAEPVRTRSGRVSKRTELFSKAIQIELSKASKSKRIKVQQEPVIIDIEENDEQVKRKYSLDTHSTSENKRTRSGREIQNHSLRRSTRTVTTLRI